MCVHLLKSEIPVHIDSRSTCKEAAMLHHNISTAAQNVDLLTAFVRMTSDQVVSVVLFPLEAINCAHRAYSNVVEHFLMSNNTSMKKITCITFQRPFRRSYFHTLSATHSFSFQLTQCNFPRDLRATHQGSENIQRTLTTHSAADRLSKSSSSPRARKTSLVYTEVLYRLSFPVLTLFWPANVKFLAAKSLPVL